MRLQLALNVDDLEKAIDFYSKLFDTSVNKRKPGYANFTLESPPLKLVLFENPGASERLNHLGVEVFEAEDVSRATERLKAAGGPGRAGRRREHLLLRDPGQGLVERPAGLALGVVPRPRRLGDLWKAVGNPRVEAAGPRTDGRLLRLAGANRDAVGCLPSFE